MTLDIIPKNNLFQQTLILGSRWKFHKHGNISSSLFSSDGTFSLNKSILEVCVIMFSGYKLLHYYGCQALIGSWCHFILDHTDLNLLLHLYLMVNVQFPDDLVKFLVHYILKTKGRPEKEYCQPIPNSLTLSKG